MRFSAATIATALLALSQSPAYAKQHLDFVDTGGETITDLGAKGDSAGDIETFDEALKEVGGQKRVGRESGFCIRTTAGKSYQCLFTITLPAGSFSVHGPWADTGESTLFITGGSGAYANAKGLIKVHSLGTTPDTWAFSIDLE